jgi:DNA-3-methyladenine glycosylase II
MTKVIATHGKCALVPYWERSPYESLVRAVAYQQLHGRAAAAILGRLMAKFTPHPFPSAEDLAAADPQGLRTLGFSAAKVTTIQGIARGSLDGIVPTRKEATELSDQELIERLTQLRGIGQWTVEMLLIFTLGRLDVMPVDDYGVKAGLQALHELESFPKKQDFARLTEKWQPYRSIGAWYLWRVADGLKVIKTKEATNGRPKR